MELRIGIDLGNVIIDHNKFGTTEEYVLAGDYNSIPPVPNVIESLKLLNESIFKNNIYILFNATDIVDHKIFEWFDSQDFFSRTGIERSNAIRSYTGRNKSAFCRQKELTHFVDDRLEVLSYLIDIVPNLYLFNSQEAEIILYKSHINNVTKVSTWAEVISKIFRV